MSLRGKAAIVGFGELPTSRLSPGKTSSQLLAKASSIAIRDAGLRKEDIDGLITFGVGEANAHHLPEYMGLNLAFSEGVTTHGASGAYSIALAAAMINAGVVNYMLCTFGGTVDRQLGGSTPS
ncbi:MAG: thiolase family protein, partial [Dehalococcoidia bacterium]|nr:thiolase family protein [Dehalococcoidia bacterium]